MQRRLLVLAVAALSSSQIGCGAENPPAAPAAASAAPSGGAELQAGSKLPAASGKVVLRIGGVALDLKTLERMPLADQSLREPFLKRDVRFTGVRIKDLLAITGMPNTARTVKFRALDDYRVELSIDDLVDSDALLATKADGKRMPVADGGPIRIVFLGDTATSRNTDNWIWSVSTMRVPAA